jgi:phosphoribosylformimino-5-aminoimidazole carboxamide ribotide isomerase
VIAVPAVDVRGGRCVQLVGGRPEAEAVSLPDPIAAARSWTNLGFSTLHFVDLDAALGSGDNLPLLRRLLTDTPATTQVGGGVRNDERAAALIGAGADRVIVGTRALDDPAWFARLAERYPERVMVALDTRDGRVLRKGWQESTGQRLADVVDTIDGLPLAGILSTDVGREGRMEGIDRSAIDQTLAAARGLPVWISGGITTEAELEYLDDLGAAGAVLGMALYTNRLDSNEIARRWGVQTEEDRA